MALLQDVRTKARHRGLTPWQLVQKIRRLEQEADETTCKVIELTTEVDELKAERTRLEGDFDQAAIDLSGCREDLQAAEDEIAYLRKRLAPFLAAEANENAVTVPPMERDTTAIEDQATGPIYVQTLRDAAAAGHLGPALAVTDPGRVPPSWARSEDDTAPVPVAEPDPATTH
jgi:outer membrane murein-binding lipoprotein Lpp